MIELERTFLVKFIPCDLSTLQKKQMLDIYLPSTGAHPTLRIRKQGDRLEITKKEPVSGNDSSRMLEQTIPLRPEEYAEMERGLAGKRVQKTRYYYPHEGKTVELDVFEGDLAGLVLADVEFELEDEKGVYQMPDFCLADVTQEKFLAGGMLCGKKYADIEKDLQRFNYQKIIVK